MRVAYEEAERCMSLDDPQSPKVGVVIVDRNGDELARAHRGEFDDGDHAEFCALVKLAHGDKSKVDDVDLSGATVYTTLEPCTYRNPPKIPCANRLIDAGVSTVWIGQYDPDPKITKLGWSQLRDNGVALHDFAEEVRGDICHLNTVFISQFTHGTGLSGSGRFDYTQRAGVYTIRSSDLPDAVEFKTSWGSMSSSGVYALARGGRVAHAREARDFIEVDDPGTFDFESHFASTSVGQIAVFEQSGGFALVKVVGVKVDPFVQVDVEWELRLPD